MAAACETAEMDSAREGLGRMIGEGCDDLIATRAAIKAAMALQEKASMRCEKLDELIDQAQYLLRGWTTF